MWIHFFNNTYHFTDPDGLDETLPWKEPWCPPEESDFSAVRGNKLHHHQDCIPRAHFDNFGWGFVTIFQIMTGENWNAIMYAGMRATRHDNFEWAFGILYIMLLL